MTSSQSTAKAATGATGSQPIEDSEAFRLAADYAWKWFALHSGQRMQLMNFLIASLALTIAGYASAAGSKRWWVACGVALSGVLLAIVFHRMDVRTRELVKVCEPSLAEIEEKLRMSSGISTLDFVREVDRPKIAATSYRVSLRVLTVSAVTLFSVGFGYALTCGIAAVA